MLYQVIATHLAEALADATRRGGGRGFPRFVEKELRSHLRCGVLEAGFARFRCDGCGLDRLVAFSCKGRGFCPSCGGRRMAALAAHLEGAVLTCVPIRQWVLSLPFPLRFRLASDHALARALLRVFLRAVFALHRRSGERCKRGRARRATGAVTVIQRFGGALNLNVHFHVLVLDGVFVERDDATVRFEPAPALRRDALDGLLRTFVARAKRLLARHGFVFDDEAPTYDPDPHPLELDEPLLARVHGASLAHRVVLGERSGLPVRRIGYFGDPEVEGGGRRPSTRLHARHLGFDLHAGVRVAAHDRARLELLCRYLLRPPISNDRLSRGPDGRVALRLKTPYRDGTTHLLFDPVELVEKLAALVPRPNKNLSSTTACSRATRRSAIAPSCTAATSRKTHGHPHPRGPAAARTLPGPTSCGTPSATTSSNAPAAETACASSRASSPARSRARSSATSAFSPKPSTSPRERRPAIAPPKQITPSTRLSISAREHLRSPRELAPVRPARAGPAGSRWRHTAEMPRSSRSSAPPRGWRVFRRTGLMVTSRARRAKGRSC